MPSEEDEVGYGKPPRKNQFKKGQSGNPNGRPKKAQDISAIVQRVIFGPIRVTVDGKTQKMAVIEAILLRLKNAALSNDFRASLEILELAKCYGEIESSAVDSIEKEKRLGKLMTNLQKRLERSAPRAEAQPSVARPDNVIE